MKFEKFVSILLDADCNSTCSVHYFRRQNIRECNRSSLSIIGLKNAEKTGKKKEVKGEIPLGFYFIFGQNGTKIVDR